MKAEKPLLVIAPTHLMMRDILREYGLDPVLARGLRFITRPAMLRGWSQGTPCISGFRDQWVLHGETGVALDRMVDILFTEGRLRIAQDADIQRARGECE